MSHSTSDCKHPLTNVSSLSDLSTLSDAYSRDKVIHYNNSDNKNVANRKKLKWNTIDLNNPVINSNTCIFNTYAYHLSARTELINWMHQLSDKLEYSAKTFHLATYLFDGLLSLYEIPFLALRLVTYLALHLSAKLEESTEKIPSLKSVVKLFNHEFTLQEMANTETMIFSAFGYGYIEELFMLS